MARPPRKPDFDWTIDAIPDAAEVSPPAAPEKAPLSARFGWLRSRAARRWLGFAALLTALLAAGAALFLRGGWHNLESQVAAEIVYEDARSAAGEADFVRAVQAANPPAWADRRAAEAALRLTAPQPGANLIPVPGSARLLALTQVGLDLFAATVQRQYADAAGQTFTFELTQRYHNRAAGLWERLPPDEAALTATVVWRTYDWQQERLVVTLPTADQALLDRLLPLVEAYAEAACADWSCPSDLAVPLVVTGRLSDSPGPGYAPRAGGSLPIVFDLAQQPPAPGDTRRLVVASPSLVGRPVDAAAEAALARAWGASVLAYLANELAGSARFAADDYLDALIAREELRLGLSPAPDLTVRPIDYVPVEDLWPASPARSESVADPAVALARHRQALAFLNTVLRARPAATDARLLGTLRRRDDLASWLTGAVDVATEFAAWRAQLTERLTTQSPLPASALDGLAYACPGTGAWLYRGGAAQPLGPADGADALDPAALSPDGRYLALVSALNDFAADASQRLVVYDRLRNEALPVIVSTQIILAGWSAGGELLFYAERVAPADGLALMHYAPGGTAERFDGAVIDPPWASLGPQWSADRTRLGVTLLPNPLHTEEPQPALVDVSTGRLTPLASEWGYTPAVAPDGQTVAYLALRADHDRLGATIVLVGASAGPPHDLVTGAGLAIGGGPPPTLGFLHWSPDGQTLGFIGAGDGTTLYLLDRATRQVTPVAGGADHYLLPLRFSADSRYVAYLENIGISDVLWLVTRDLSTGQETRYPIVFGHLLRIVPSGAALSSGVAAWSPSGHLLVVSSHAGVFAYDPATGAVRWLTLSECGRAVWYSLSH